MFEKYEDYETAALIVGAALFIIAERVLPGRSVDRTRGLKLDLLAFAVVVVGAGLARKGFHALFDRAHVDAAIDHVSFLQRLPSVAKVGLALLTVDFCLYWVHRSMHRFDALWRTHAWHHSTTELYWFSGFRTSFTHAILYALPQVLIPFYVFKLTLLELAVGFSIGVFSQLFIHSSVDVSLGPLDAILVTPRYHRVHHSRSALQSKNIGTSITLWDRMFGTYVDPRTVDSDHPLGLDEAASARMVIGV